MAQMDDARYFLTVEWCNSGKRGVFCSAAGNPFAEDDSPHTDEEMQDILGPFWMILSPKSELITKDDLTAYTLFRPLAEYSNAYGIALRE
jgi:hypothetical protein